MANNDNRQLMHTTGGRKFLRKHGFSIVMGLIIITLLISPEAKSWLMRQVMRTGVYNATLKPADTPANASPVADFDFSDTNGQIQNTSSLRGKVVFINFWATWCPPCLAEFPSIQTLYTQFKDRQDISFLMINEDDELAAGAAYAQKKGYTVPQFRIRSTLPASLYSGNLPTTLVMDKKGNVRFRHEGLANYASAGFIQQLEALAKE